MDRTREIVRVSAKGIGANLILVVFKAAVGLMARSIAVVLDAVNNLSDALSSLITIIGTRLAGRAADREHPYGHGRIEYVTSSVIAIIVLIAGLTSLRESVEKIISPQQPSYTYLSLIVIVAGVAAKFLLGRYFKRKGRQLASGALIASGTDAAFDAILSIGTLVGAGASMLFGLNLEGYIGAIISLFILKAGIDILRETMSEIIGARVDEELSTSIKESLNAYPEVHGSYDLLLHSYGPQELMGSVHVEVDDALSAREIDALCRRMTADIYRRHGVLLTIGIYASNTSSEAAQAIRAALKREIAKYPQVLQMHGFYVDEAAARISFDVIVDFQEPDRPAVAEKLRSALQTQFPAYTVSVNLDRDFSD